MSPCPSYHHVIGRVLGGVEQFPVFCVEALQASGRVYQQQLVQIATQQRLLVAALQHTQH